MRFKLTGPFRYTFNAAEAVQVSRMFGAKTIVPIHYAGWTHFVESVSVTKEAFERSGLSGRVKWLIYREEVGGMTLARRVRGIAVTCPSVQGF